MEISAPHTMKAAISTGTKWKLLHCIQYANSQNHLGTISQPTVISTGTKM
jgi:hypothetical protein